MRRASLLGMITPKLQWIALLPLVTGCVAVGKYDEAVARAERSQRDARTARMTAAELQKELDAIAGQYKETSEHLAAVMVAGAACSTALDEATAINQGLRSELEKSGKDVDALLTDRGALTKSLTDARARLEELRRAQASAEARAHLFHELALKLKRMIDAGDLQILLREGRMVLVLPNDVLFDSGKKQLKPAGRAALQQIASVLKTISGRKFQVSGHTDNEPIRFSPYSSNWELSTARALEVVALLVESGIRPEALSAAGYGEFDPIAANDSAPSRARNRRTEITLQPNIDDLVAVPEPR